MIRILADISFGLFATSTLAGPFVAQVGADGLYSWLSRFGALGLCAFMVFQNYRQSADLGKIIKRKDEAIDKRDQEIICLTRSLATALEKNTQALGEMSESLNNRPCMAQPRVQT